MKNSSSRILGFSLIELMVVMLIIGIISAFAVPAASSILKGSQMTQASQILTDQINNARQIALTRNHLVEVRFIRFQDPETPNDTGADGGLGNFRAIWVFEDTGAVNSNILDTNGNPTPIMAPVDKPQMFPQAIVMSTSATLSTLLQNASVSPSANPNDPQTFPRAQNSSTTTGIQYTYVPFRFLADGSTNLLPQTKLWFATLVNVNDPVSNNGPPANFFTLLVDPVMGSVKLFRPGI